MNSLLPKANADFIRDEMKEAEQYKEERDGESPAFHDHQALPDLRLVCRATRYDNLLSSPRRLAPPSPYSSARENSDG